jgi:hypothetical protein
MRFLSSVVLAALVGLCASVVAQQPGQPGGRGGRGGPPGGGGGFFAGGMGPRSRLLLLSVPAVRKELELADEQVTEIEKIADEIRAKYNFGGFGGRPGGGPGGRGPGGGDGDRNRRDNNEGALRFAPASWYFAVQEPQNQPGGQSRRFGGGGGFPMITPEQRAEFEKQRLERSREEAARLAEVLLPHQVKRLNELFVQQNGVGALQDEEIAKELGISEAQKAKLAEVREANEAASRSLIGQLFQGGGRGGDENTRAKLAEMRQVNDGKLLAVLTSDQQKKFEAMKGKPFEMPEDAFRFGGGRGGRGGGGNRPEGNNNP